MLIAGGTEATITVASQGLTLSLSQQGLLGLKKTMKAHHLEPRRKKMQAHALLSSITEQCCFSPHTGLYALRVPHSDLGPSIITKTQALATAGINASRISWVTQHYPQRLMGFMLWGISSHSSALIYFYFTDHNISFSMCL